MCRSLLDPEDVLVEQLLQEPVPVKVGYTSTFGAPLSLIIGACIAASFGILPHAHERMGGHVVQEPAVNMGSAQWMKLEAQSHAAILGRSSKRDSVGRKPGLLPWGARAALDVMDDMKRARRVATAARENSGDATTLVVGGAGAVAASLAVNAALQASGVPEEQAQAAVLFCVGTATAAVVAMSGGGADGASEQVARSEAAVMGPTSVRPPLQSTPPGVAATGMLKDQGVVRLDGVLTAESAAAVRGEVSERLAAVISKQQGKDEDRSELGPVLCRSSRYDLLLKPDDGPVEAALREILGGPVGELMLAMVGKDAPLYELAALVSDDGAPRQPIHPDTGYQAEAPLYTVFVALQDVSVEMGPTLFLPGTHTEKAHKEFNNDLQKESLLARTPFYGSTLSKGDCSVFDSRLLHAGAQNAKGRRVMLYFTFANLDANLATVPAGSIAPEARGSYRLADFRPEAS